MVGTYEDKSESGQAWKSDSRGTWGKRSNMNAQILIVDDEPSIRDSLHAVLSAEGYGVDLAGDLPEAIGFLAERTYDVVVSDVKLPGGGGIELLDSIRAACPNAPVIFITGDPTVETADRKSTRLNSSHYS